MMIKVSKRKVTVAMDIGTSGSACAFASNDVTPIEILLVEEWAGSSKAPTAILFDPDGAVHFGQEALDNWNGKDSEEKVISKLYTNFKTLLYHKGDEDLPKAKDSRGLNPIALEILFSEVIKSLKESAMKKIARYIPKVDPKKNIQWVLTVPAIWSAEAKGIMRKAAKLAGLWSEEDSEQLLICLEPEGGALSARSYVKDRNLLGPKSGYIVVDCGGGTIDIVAHRIDSNGKDVAEIVAPTGNLSGSYAIDRSFVSLLKKIFGEPVLDSMSEESSWDQFLRSFEKEKCKPIVPAKMRIEMKPVLKRKLEEMLGNDLSSVFEDHEGISFDDDSNSVVLTKSFYEENLVRPVVNSIMDLLDSFWNDLSKTLRENEEKEDCMKTIFLIGGFAANKLLEATIADFAIAKKLELVTPPHAFLSVLKGAVEFGFNPSKIKARIAARTYGVKCIAQWRKGDPEDLRMITEEGYVWCKDVFDAIVKKGEPLLPDTRWSEEYETKEEKLEVEILAHKLESKVRVVREVEMERAGIARVEFAGKPEEEVVSVTIELSFGGTELMAKIYDSWSKTFKEIPLEF